MIDKSFQWQKTAVSLVAATLSLWLFDAAALSLGRISVQSALGEPLRAEIEVPVITAEESASLVVTMAPPSAFSAAGMEYSPVLAGTQISLVKRSDGRSILRLSSDRPVNDAFMDIILEATWASGRIVRDFTLLLDPPNLRQSNLASPAPTQLPAVAAAPQTSTASSSISTAAEAPGNTQPNTFAPARSAAPSTVTPAVKPATVASAARDGTVRAPQIRVRPGDTAGRIAAAHKPAHMSLDQMLVALLRSNPGAFVGNDLNRIKAGAVLDLPLQDVTESGQAQRTLVAQSKDFNDYRGKVASNAPQAVLAPADRQASGKVQARVQDEKSGAPTPDKLTLSKGAVQAGGSESQLAKERSLQEAADKAAALARNIEELNKLKAAPGSNASAAGSGTASATVASSIARPSSPALAASAPKAPPSASVGGTEDGLLQSLISDPAAPIWAASLIALLAALGVYRVKQRKVVEESEEPSFLASRLKPDSFFSASPDEEAKPADEFATGSSLLNPSSLARAAGESDPVAEAEVYLAYGRDLQAEEVLREALRIRPELPGVHQKLLEILAKRGDAPAFEAVARELHAITSGQGPDWERARELGESLDPGSPLYRDPSLAMVPDLPTQVDELPMQPAQVPDKVASELDIDLDLDFSLEEIQTAPTVHDELRTASAQPDPLPPVPLAQNSLPEPTAQLEPEIEFDLDLGNGGADIETSPTETAAPAPDIELPDLRFDTAELTLASQPSADEQTHKPEAEPEPDPAEDGPITNPGALEFDFGSLSLELDTPAPTPDEAPAAAENDPLITKLALADEFAAIGDQEGARALIEEVIAQASGDLQSRAHQALKKL